MVQTHIDLRGFFFSLVSSAICGTFKEKQQSLENKPFINQELPTCALWLKAFKVQMPTRAETWKGFYIEHSSFNPDLLTCLISHSVNKSQTQIYLCQAQQIPAWVLIGSK